MVIRLKVFDKFQREVKNFLQVRLEEGVVIRRLGFFPNTLGLGGCHDHFHHFVFGYFGGKVILTFGEFDLACDGVISVQIGNFRCQIFDELTKFGVGAHVIDDATQSLELCATFCHSAMGHVYHLVPAQQSLHAAQNSDGAITFAECF